jgi:hypothetical protein
VKRFFGTTRTADDESNNYKHCSANVLARVREKNCFVLVFTPQWQRDMNKRNEAGFTRCIGVLCRWLGARSIAS